MAKSQDLIACRSCGQSIKKRAFKCPHCQVRFPGLSKVERTISILLLAIIVMGVVVAVSTPDGYNNYANKKASSLTWLPIATKHQIVHNYVHQQTLGDAAIKALYPCVSQKLFTQPQLLLSNIFSVCRNLYASTPEQLQQFVNFDLFQQQFSADGTVYLPLQSQLHASNGEHAESIAEQVELQFIFNQQPALIAQITQTYQPKDEVEPLSMVVNVDVATGKTIATEQTPQ